jgi:hypothetical protein
MKNALFLFAAIVIIMFGKLFFFVFSFLSVEYATTYAVSE